MKRTRVVVLLSAAVLGSISPAVADAPAPGTCWPFTDKHWDRATLAPVAPVDCTTSHTAEAMGSVQIPDGVSRRGERVIWAWAYRACHTVGLRYVWAEESARLPLKSYSLPMSAQLATFIPTRAQRRSGQRWVSCVGFNTTPAGKATSRVGSVAGSGLLPHLCVNYKTSKWQACSAPRSAVMTNVVWLKPYGAAFPGSEATESAKMKCTALAGRTMYARAWYVPGSARWKYGDHFGYCEIVEKTSV